METAARCEGPSFWLAGEHEPRNQATSHGENTSSGSSSDASVDSPLCRSAGSGPTAAARGVGETTASIFGFYAPPASSSTSSSSQLQELSAFLATSGAATDHLPGHGAMSSTLLDELLGANDDMEQLPASRAMAGATSHAAASTGDGLGEGMAGLLDISARQAAALLHGTSSSILAAQPSPHHATARLLQLEDNYERKKKRAKINRKDLNARFQELMELLHLREDRKLNRAKVLEKAIEHIEKLTAELRAVKAQLGGSSDAQSTDESQVSRHSSVHKATAMVPIALPARRVAGTASEMQHHAIAPLNCSSTTTMMPIAAGAHPWGSAAASTLPLTSMVWVPCPVVGHPMSASLAMDTTAARGGSSTSSKRRKLKRTREVDSEYENSVDEQQQAQDKQMSGNASAARDVEMAPTSVTSSGVAVAVWVILEIPTVLQFCDAWSLASVMQTCKELERAARRKELWASLVRRRWRVAVNGPQRLPAQQQWVAWHTCNRMPDCSSITPEGFHFATGRERNVNAWGLLSRRSNGRTTRTVLVSGRATVMQVVELYVVVQNMGHTCVRLTDRIAVTSGEERRQLASPFTVDSGAHLTPHVVAFNSTLCTMAGVAGVELHHGDVCVLSVFLHCEGLDLEEEFLQQAGRLCVQVESESPRGCSGVLEIQAQCHVTTNQQHKRALSS